MSRWGDDEDDDFLPPTTSEGPDKNGMKTYTEYKMDETGRKMKVEVIVPQFDCSLLMHNSFKR